MQTAIALFSELLINSLFFAFAPTIDATAAYKDMAKANRIEIDPVSDI